MLWPETVERLKNGSLAICGTPLPELAALYGTPLYVYDEQTLRNRSRAAVNAFVERYPNTRVVYAGKAGMLPGIVPILASEGLGIDVVSGGELFVALKAGFDPPSITLHGNYKSETELREAIAARIGLIAVDNLDELDLLERLCAEQQVEQAILLRLNPGIDVHTHGKIATGVVDSKFGFPIWDGSARTAVAAALASGHLQLRGYHAHIGSQLFDLAAYQQTVELIAQFAAEVRDEVAYVPEILSPGGGIGIAYLPDAEESSFAEWAEMVTGSLVSAFGRRQLPLPELVVEPGRSITGPAALALYSVGSVKRIEGVRTYVAIDGGMADNIRPSLYDASYTAAIANRDDGAAEVVTIAGRYCESGDVLIRDITLPAPQAGDLIAVPAAGAYCLAMASNYNLVGRPAVVLITDAGPQLIRRRETYEDMITLDSLAHAGESSAH